MLQAVATSIIDATVDLSVIFSDDVELDSTITRDHIREYACEVTSLGLLFMNYKDAIREGDGSRVMMIWKFLLPLFKATDRHNYAIEAFHTLANQKLLPERQAHQLTWSRFVKNGA